MKNLKLKRGGIQKEYEQTRTKFIKKGMWPERYHNEINGLTAASKCGVEVPQILASSLTEAGGNITMRRIDLPRIDQIVWDSPQYDLFKKMGEISAQIHEIPNESKMTLALLKRRFQDLQTDVSRISALRSDVTDMVVEVVKAISQRIMDWSKPTFTHGDFTIQNMFYGDKIIVFDWEHSGSGSSLYDIGTFLSFMILLVTDGVWSFNERCEATKYFMDGYIAQGVLTHDDQRIIDALRFLGHRQIAQYYLCVLEYLVLIEQNSIAEEVLNSKSSTHAEKLHKQLCNLDVYFDKIWFHKIVAAIRRGQRYQLSYDFWEWFKKEIQNKEKR